MVSDGILPSNEGRGYVLRRLIRRAARHGRMLGIGDLFLARLSETVITENADGYPELAEKREFIHRVLSEEEEKFNRTIDQGLAILAELEDNLTSSGKGTVLPGEDAFKLYDTYGFPLDLTEEILAEKGFSVDRAGFDACMERQKTTARAARKETNYMGKDASVYDELDPGLCSVFIGYDRLEGESSISAMTSESEVVSTLSEGQHGTLITDDTPFYAKKGGQVGDTGVISSGESRFVVKDTIPLAGDKIGHIGKVESGSFSIGDTVSLSVDKARRMAIARNHSATHLLQRALREVLGDHVQQAGSDVNAERLRFDFTHFSAMTPAEIEEVEQKVNDRIAAAVDVETQIMSLAEARKSGAMALFGEKYGDEVRVVKMGDYSTELCGGTHVSNTAEISAFKLLSESGVASGVRRIEALTGAAVFAYYQKIEKAAREAASLLKVAPDQLSGRIRSLQKEIKALSSENESLKSAQAKDALGDVASSTEEIGGLSFLAKEIKDVDMNGLRSLGDELKQKLGEGVIVLASASNGKVNLIAMATEAAVKAGAHAGNLIKAIAPKVGGGGGGRPNMAQAGGKNPAGIADALAEAGKVLKEMV